MSKRSTTYTHQGWFWLCPILLAPGDDTCPVEARWPWLEWLFSACELIEIARLTLADLFISDYEPSFMFAAVTILPAPIVRTYES